MADSLAVRHRPRCFADVAGQRHVSAVLRSAAARQSPPQQILLAGGSGLGKTTLARIFAAALFCSERTDGGDACGSCDSCRDVTGPGGFHPDVIELDAASNGGKDEVREIAARAALAPLRAEWKVYIIDEAHGLTGPGGQAFLKLLEEPPAHTVFVLATTDPEKLPTAVRGRCSILEVLPPTTVEMAGNLHRIAELEKWALGDEAVEAVLAASDPALGMRGTVMTLEKLAGPLSKAQEVSGELLESLLGTVSPSRLRDLTAAIVSGQRNDALLALDGLSVRTGSSLLRRQLAAWARAQLVEACRTGQGAESAYYRYEVLTTAGTYDGALDVAVAKMSTPALDDSAQAVRALLEQAQDLLSSLTAAQMSSSTAPPTPVTPAPATSAPTPAAPAPATSAPTPAAPAPAASATSAPAPATSSRIPLGTTSTGSRAARASAPRAAATAPAAAAAPVQANAAPAAVQSSAPVPVGAGDSDFVLALNTVGRSSARAASVLRACSVTRNDAGLLAVSVPAPVAERAADTQLLQLLERLIDEGALPQFARLLP